MALTQAPQWSIYILECADGSLYTGASTDVDRRVVQHNSGTGAKYTRSRLPAKLVYVETCSDHSSALKREAEIKKLTRLQKKKLISPS